MQRGYRSKLSRFPSHKIGVAAAWTLITAQEIERAANFRSPRSLRKFYSCVLNSVPCKVPRFSFYYSVSLYMNQRLIAEIGRTQRLAIINSLKRTKGMSVNELVDKMGMSYMGIKQHCLTLQRDGYLDTWRRPQKMGRPEMVYRLTRRSHDLFQSDSNQLTLDLLKSAREIYGANAPEKLLYNMFEKKTAAVKAKAKGNTVAERAKWLARIRDAEGYMAQFRNDGEGGPHILECHSPIMNMLERYPIIARLEQDMFEKILHTPVRRQMIRNSGLYECAFYFAV
jgi:predicted ArsR family transcriptional regulator